MIHIILPILIFLQLCCVVMLIRNNMVHSFRGKIIDRIGEINRQEIQDGKEYLGQRWKTFESVNYDHMVLKFWIPLKVENWWKDAVFISEMS